VGAARGQPHCHHSDDGAERSGWSPPPVQHHVMFSLLPTGLVMFARLPGSLGRYQTRCGLRYDMGPTGRGLSALARFKDDHDAGAEALGAVDTSTRSNVGPPPTTTAVA